MGISPRTLRPSSTFTPRSISGLALWLDASSSDLYTTDAGPVVAVNQPTDIAGCVGWWDASEASTLFAADTGDTLATTTVGRWANKVSGGSDKDLLQTDSTKRPTITASYIGGMQSIVFDGVNDVLLRSFTLDATCHLFCVMKWPAAYASTVRATDGFTANTLSILRFSNTSISVIGSNPTLLAGTGNSLAPLIVEARKSTSGRFAINGAGQSEGSLDTTAPNGLTLGAFGGGTTSFDNVGFAEVIAFSDPLSVADAARVSAYLAAKWAISGVHRSAAQEIAAVASPTEIAGLTEWFDATDTSGTVTTVAGNKVSSWASKVAGGRTLTQGNDSLRPVMTDNIQNGLRMAKFDGVDDFIRTATPETFADKTVFIVARPTDVSATQAVWGASKQNITLYGYFYSAGFRVNSAAIAVRPETAGAAARRIAASANEAIITSLQFKTSELVANNFASIGPYKNGTLFDNNDSIILSDYAIGSTMGANDSRPAAGVLSNFYSGYVGEVLIYDAYLSAVDRARVEKYLQQKWATPAVPDPTPPVGYWGDRSGNGRHAVQATAGSRPLVGSIASGRGLVFDSNDSLLSLASMADIIGAPASSPATTIAFIALNSSGAAGFTMGANDAANGRLLVSNSFDAAGASFFDVAGTSGGRLSYTLPASSQTTASVYIMQRNGASMIVRRNGATIATKADASQTYAATTARLALGQAVGLTGFAGTCASVLCYPSALTATQYQRLEQYLAARWGITLAPQVANADAQNWIDRVYQNGGTVSSATAAAVNTFCEAIDAAGIRDRFYRMGIFAGSNLNAALVPLYRGPSLGGTQYGNTTDTNNAFVGVGTDYAETGASGGLTGNGSTKFLNTGLAPDSIGVTGHASAYVAAHSAQNAYYIQSFNSRDLFGLRGWGSPVVQGFWGVQDAPTFSGTQTGGLWQVSRTSASGSPLITLYKNGSQQDQLATVSASVLTHSLPMYVFAGNTNGSAGAYLNGRMMGYSVGLPMTAAQVTAYNTAMQAFQTALTRNV